MKLNIIKLGDKRLRQRSEEVALPLSPNDKKLANDLLAYLDYAARPDNDERPGVGIAAVQIGILKRMFAIRVPFTKDDYFKEILLNPKIIFKSGKAAFEGGEGCLSVDDDRKGLVHRSNKIKMTGYSVLKEEHVEYELEGYLSIVFQHEYDHLDGKLYFNRIDPLSPEKKLKNEVLI